MKTAFLHGRMTRRRASPSGCTGAYPACHAASPPPQQQQQPERGLQPAAACGAVAGQAALRRMQPRRVAWELPLSPALSHLFPP